MFIACETDSVDEQLGFDETEESLYSVEDDSQEIPPGQD